MVTKADYHHQSSHSALEPGLFLHSYKALSSHSFALLLRPEPALNWDYFVNCLLHRSFKSFGTKGFVCPSAHHNKHSHAVSKWAAAPDPAALMCVNQRRLPLALSEHTLTLCHELHTRRSSGVLISIARSTPGNLLANMHPHDWHLTSTDHGWPGTALEQPPASPAKPSNTQLFPEECLFEHITFPLVWVRAGTIK